MKKSASPFFFGRRKTVKMLALGSTATLFGLPGSLFANAAETGNSK
jgi:hypothetical protein